MGELLDFLKFLYDAGAAVIPWLLVTVALFLTFKTWPHFVDLIQARAKAQQDIAVRESERNEILRHNNIVISNCTETMRMIKSFMEERDYKANSAIEQHEQLSQERVERLQAGIDDVSSDVGKLKNDTSVLLDRSLQRRKSDFR